MAGVKGMQWENKKVVNGTQDEFVQTTADALMSGKFMGLKTSKAGAPTDKDREAIMRICGMVPDEFNGRLAVKMGELADKVVSAIDERLPDFKTSELAYVLSVLEDKRSTLNGRTALTASSVNVQINNYGEATSKEQILERLFPSRNTQPIELVADVI